MGPVNADLLQPFPVLCNQIALFLFFFFVKKQMKTKELLFNLEGAPNLKGWEVPGYIYPWVKRQALALGAVFKKNVAT